jgi:hypothetical protein
VFSFNQSTNPSNSYSKINMVSTATLLPTIDLAPFLADPTSTLSLAECKKAYDAVQKYSAFAIRDPRVTEEQNEV